MKWPFGRAKVAPSSGTKTTPQFSHASSPQYNAGVEPAGSARQDGYRAPYAKPGTNDAPPNYVKPDHPAIITAGFHEGDGDYVLSYGLRAQPDVGGALNYAYESYDLPLSQPAGAFMVAATPFKPFGATPLQAWPTAVPTGAGLFPGQVISQPLLNPQGPDNGYDIYN